MNQNLEIKITGSGTKAEILLALNLVIASLNETEDYSTGAGWEDSTLFTEVNECEAEFDEEQGKK